MGWHELKHQHCRCEVHRDLYQLRRRYILEDLGCFPCIKATQVCVRRRTFSLVEDLLAGAESFPLRNPHTIILFDKFSQL